MRELHAWHNNISDETWEQMIADAKTVYENTRAAMERASLNVQELELAWLQVRETREKVS